MENTQQKQRKGGKLSDRWLGPYTINRNLGKGVYELKNSSGRVLKMKCNIARLKVMYFNVLYCLLVCLSFYILDCNLIGI